MKTVTLTLKLPGALAAEAGEAGLLTSESLTAILRREVQQRRVNNLISAFERLDREETNALGIEEIAAEIAAAREERRSGASCS